MAKKIIAYILEEDGTVPTYVEDGGYFGINEEYVGRSVDEASVPEGIQLLDRAALAARLDSMNLKDREGNPVDTETVLGVFLNLISMSDLE